MKLICPSDIGRCIPFHVKDGPSETGPRLGGRAPENVLPLRLTDHTQYFATLPLCAEPSLEASIFFLGPDIFDADTSTLQPANPFLEIVTHSPSTRRNDKRFASKISEHAIITKSERDDADGDCVDPSWKHPFLASEVISNHKFGGRAFIFQWGRWTDSKFSELELLHTQGFVQVIQIAMPVGRRDGKVKGTWPFGDGHFHLYGRPPFSTMDWRWFWETG